MWPCKLEGITMKYMDYSQYQNLNSKTQYIKWVIYLPVKHGASETIGNVSLVHNAISLLKNTLKSDGTPHKDSVKIIKALRDKSNDLLAPIRGESVLFVIYRDDTVDSYIMPITVDVGYITDMKDMFLKPISEFYKQDDSYYFLELHQKGCQLYEWDKFGIKKIDDPELQKSLSASLRLDEPEDKNVQTHRLSSLNVGISQGVHGQGGYKDRHGAYIIQYLQFIDGQLSKYSKSTLKPIVLVGSKQLSSAFKKISHNKHQIKGYMANLPSKFDVNLLNTQLVKY